MESINLKIPFRKNQPLEFYLEILDMVIKSFNILEDFTLCGRFTEPYFNSKEYYKAIFLELDTNSEKYSTTFEFLSKSKFSMFGLLLNIVNKYFIENSISNRLYAKYIDDEQVDVVFANPKDIDVTSFQKGYDSDNIQNVIYIDEEKLNEFFKFKKLGVFKLLRNVEIERGLKRFLEYNYHWSRYHIMWYFDNLLYACEVRVTSYLEGFNELIRITNGQLEVESLIVEDIIEESYEGIEKEEVEISAVINNIDFELNGLEFCFSLDFISKFNEFLKHNFNSSYYYLKYDGQAHVIVLIYLDIDTYNSISEKSDMFLGIDKEVIELLDPEDDC